jgi:DNA-binding transcriptional regulator YhcF (GntR family)
MCPGWTLKSLAGVEGLAPSRNIQCLHCQPTPVAAFDTKTLFARLPTRVPHRPHPPDDPGGPERSGPARQLSGGRALKVSHADRGGADNNPSPFGASNTSAGAVATSKGPQGHTIGGHQLGFALDATRHPGQTSPCEEQRRRALCAEFVTALERCKTHDEKAALEQAFERDLVNGGEHNYRRSSTDREAPKLRLDRNVVARIRFKLEMIERGAFKAGKNIPASVARVLKALLDKALYYGRLCPSLETLADWACIHSKTTVRKALDQLESFGFVVVYRRRKTVRTPLSFKVVQDTNSYEVREPPTPAERVKASEFSSWRESSHTSLLNSSSHSEGVGGGAAATPKGRLSALGFGSRRATASERAAAERLEAVIARATAARLLAVGGPA